MCQLHPPASDSPLDQASEVIAEVDSIQVSAEEVQKAISSFPCGSAGGPDGIRPQHLVELLKCPVAGPQLLISITSFVNCLLRGNCPVSVRPILFGATLIALNKKTGGVRPIAIGYVWRRIAAKCANAVVVTKLLSYLHPLQVGVGTPGGCEAAVHAVRRYLKSMPSTHVISKLDFSNAFNCVKRSAVLNEVRQKIPEILNFCALTYGAPTKLRFGDFTVLSSEGVQQGDPMGPLLFCLTIQPLLMSLKSDLVLGYLDDVTIAGESSSVSQDVSRVLQACPDLGLRLNVSKCELISNGVCSLPDVFSSFMQVHPDEALLLGSPLLSGAAMNSVLTKLNENLIRASQKLTLITSHDALTILKSSVGAPNLTYTLRSSPCSGNSILNTYDETLRQAITKVINVEISDAQWLQASLPVRMGGLGIRSVSVLAPSAFLASAAGTRDLQDALLSKSPAALIYSNPDINSSLTVWSTLTNTPPPDGSSAFLQSSWDLPVCSTILSSLVETATDPLDKARLLAVSAKHSSDWLHALPISACGLRLDDEAIRVSVSFRLGCKVCEPHICPCGALVESNGTHGMACKQSSGRSSRHQLLNDIIWNAINKAGVPAVKEPSGLCRTDGKRPDGLTQIPWDDGRCLTWDVTVSDTLAASNLSVTSLSAGSAAEKSALNKARKYSELSATYSFVPLAFETLGPVNSSGADFISSIGYRRRAITGEAREATFLWQRLSIAVQRFNSVCLNGTFGGQS